MNGKTLWMGNIEHWMDGKYITGVLNELEIFPKHITINKNENKRGNDILKILYVIQ